MAADVSTYLYWSEIGDPNNSSTDTLEYIWYDVFVYMKHDDPDAPFDDSYWYNLPTLHSSLGINLRMSPRICSTIPSLEPAETGKGIHLTVGFDELQIKTFIKYHIEDYTRLVTWQHRKPKFLEFVTTMVRPFVDIMNSSWTLESRGYDIDRSTGAELDVLGEWIGLSRHVSLEIPESFFGWGYTPDSDPRNWGGGKWAAGGVIPKSVYALDDSIYRFFLKLKIILNGWDGTVPGLYEAFDSMFSSKDCTVNVRDNQDMTMSFTLRMDTENELYLLLLQQDYLKIRPAAVGITYRIAPLADIFWTDHEKDVEIGIWDDGVWHM